MYLLQGNKHLLTLNLLMEEVIYKKKKPEFKSYQFSGHLNYYSCLCTIHNTCTFLVYFPLTPTWLQVC